MNRLLTYADAAEACQMSVWWIREQVRFGRIYVTYFGNRPRIRMEDWELFVSSIPSVRRSNPNKGKIQLVDNKR